MASLHELSISHQYLLSIFYYDQNTGIFTRIRKTANSTKVGAIIGHHDPQGYLRHRINKKTVALHRLAWFYVYQRWPTDQIDHINNIRDDNRLINLRESTSSQNNCNQPPNIRNKVGCRGIHFRKDTQTYQVRLSVNKQEVYSKSFHNLQDALAARKAAVLLYHGSFGKP